ncbi:MAG: hypothetical protein ACO1O6_08315 [Bacteroidota bacterium]
MVRYFITGFLIFQSIAASGQEQQDNLLETDSSWSRELFYFPLNFAPEINFQGHEEAVFPPNWAKKDSSDFWSYAFAWSINLNSRLSARKLENSLQHYFDGLMQAVNQDTTIKIPSAKADFRSEKQTGGIVTFTGKLTIYDAFATKKTLILHVTVKQYFCREQQKSLVLFLLSPKEFEHKVWHKLGKIKLRSQACRI